MKVTPTNLPDVFVIEPIVYRDRRGFFMETHQQPRYAEAGIDRRFVQDNLSRSTQGVLRGLHYQIHHPQAKLVQVILGEVFDVAVDIRPGSPHFGQWVGVTLSGDNQHQLYIPEGFAHGFCVLSSEAMFLYKCTDIYRPEDEGGVLWSDPAVGIHWPVIDPVLSDKDRAYRLLADIPTTALPQVEALS